MKLKIKFLKWSAGIPVAMLDKKTAEEIGVHIKDRISIRTLSQPTKEIFTIVDTVTGIVKKDEIAVSSELRNRLYLRGGQKVEVNLESTPNSLNFIKKKLNKKLLSKSEINEIIKDVVDNSLSEAEVALFISAMYNSGMNFKETTYLIDAIVESGNKLSFKDKLVADKHSIGGIAGRTTPIIVSICASAGLIIPKTSSRAITTPAGTADSMETLAKIDFSIKELKKIVEKTGACIVWGGGLGMVPADSKIIRVEKQLNIDPESQLLASIMAKKIAVGSKYIVINIPYGKSAKVNKRKALILKEKFEKLGKHFKRKIKCVLVKNNGPIGNGIGPALEMLDVIKVLKREDSCYKLEDISLKLSGILLELTNKAGKNKGRELAKEILDSGRAFEKFKQIIKAQKGRLKKIKLGKFRKNILYNKSGKIIDIDNKKINSIARDAGCPIDKFSGIYLYFHVGDKIKKGNKIMTIYSESKSRLNKAVNSYMREKPIKIK